jgi:type I restriction enzyme M protein
LNLEETEQSKIFKNEDFGYWKVTVERPLRLSVSLTAQKLADFEKVCIEAKEKNLFALIEAVAKKLGSGPHNNFNLFQKQIEDKASALNVKLSAKAIKLIQNHLAIKDENAAPVIKKILKAGKVEANPIEGLFLVPIDGKEAIVEYEPDNELRDTEQVPLFEDGGIEAFIKREVLPHVPDAWVDIAGKKIGYEIYFNRYFYKPQKLRTLEEIKADIFALEKETEGLLKEIVGELPA